MTDSDSVVWGVDSRTGHSSTFIRNLLERSGLPADGYRIDAICTPVFRDGPSSLEMAVAL